MIEREVIALANGASVVLGEPLGRHDHVIAATITRAGRDAPAVVKLDTAGTPADNGNNLADEQRLYETLAKVPGGNSARVLDYYGAGLLYKGDSSTRKAIVLERALCSLNDVARSSADGAVQLREELAVLTAFAMLTTIREFRRLRGHPTNRFSFVAHRDLKSANAFLVERDGVLDVAVGDFGYAYDFELSKGRRIPEGTITPEQAADSQVDPSYETDLWGVGLSVWAVLYRGLVPYRAPALEPTPWPAEGTRFELGMTVDFTPRYPEERDARVSDDSLALRVAQGLLSTGAERVAFADQVYFEIAAAHKRIVQSLSRGPDAVQRRAQIDHAIATGLDSGRKSSPERHIPLDSSDLQLLNDGLGSLPKPPLGLTVQWRRLTPMFGQALVATGSSITWAAGAASRLLLITFQSFGVAAAVTALALLAGWWQWLAIPDTAVDTFVQWLAAGLFGAAIILMGLQQLIRGLATARFGRPRVPVAGPMLAASFTAALLILLVTQWLELALVPSGISLVGAASISSAFVDNGIRSLMRRATTSRRGRSVRGAITTTVAVIGCAAIMAVSSVPAVASVLNNHARTPRIDALVPGIPAIESSPGVWTEMPVLIDPHAMAVNSRGDVAVVDRSGIDRDTVWIVPKSASSPAYRVLNTLGWNAPAEGVLQSPPERTTAGPFPQWLLDSVSDSVDPVRSVEAIDFVDDDTLVLLGLDGLTRLDFGEGSTTTRISDAVTTSDQQFGRTSQVFVDGGTIYVARVTAKGEVQDMRWCAWSNSGKPPVYTVPLDGDGEATAVLSASSVGPAVSSAVSDADATPVPCLDDVTALYRDESGTVMGAGNRWVDGGQVAQVFAMPGGVGTTIAQRGSDWRPRSLASNGGRLLVNEGYCLSGISTGEAPKEMPDFLAAASAKCSGVEVEGEVPIDPDCSQVNANTVSVLRSDRYHWKPMATGGPDGDIYIVAPPLPGCTPIIQRLEADGGLSSVGAIRSQSQYAQDYELGSTAIMSANRPRIVDKTAYWYAPGLGRVRSSQSGTDGVSMTAFLRGDGAPRVQVRLNDGLVVELGTYTDSERSITELAATQVIDGAWHVARLDIPGLTDLVYYDDLLYISRCGQVLTIDPEKLRRLPALVPAADGNEYHPLALAEIAADVTLVAGKGTVDTPCTPITSIPEASTAGLIGSDIAPLALDVQSTINGGLRLAFTEAALFGDTAVSRLRIANTDENWIRTVGFDPANSVHIDENNDPTGTVLAGDLTDDGLVGTDISLRNGRVVVSTATSETTGPLLLIADNEITVLDPGDGREVTGTTWSYDDRVVITDGARGDLAVLEISSFLENRRTLLEWLGVVVDDALRERRGSPPSG